MRDSLRRRRTWIGIAVSLIALWYAASGVDWRSFVAILQDGDYIWLLPAALAVVLGQFLRAARWRQLFATASRPGFRDTFAVLCVGYLVSTVFPLRLGDPFRAWAIERQSDASLVEALATIAVERARDLLTIFLLLAVLASEPEARLLHSRFGAGPWAQPDTLRWLTAGLVLLAYLALVVSAALGRRLGEMTAGLLQGIGIAQAPSERLAGIVASFAEALRPLRKPGRALAALGWSVLVWSVGALSYWLVLFTFDIRLPFAAAVFVMGCVAFAAILPSTPGYAGVFHAAVVFGLVLVADVSKDQAFSYAIIEHGLTMGVLVLMGPIGLRMLGLGRRELDEGVARSGGAL
jgi:uncharacterized protein (TIRG00374 family)